MPPVLENGIIEELTERRKEIIKEGNILLSHLYNSMGRVPKKTYSFSELLQTFRTLHFSRTDSRVFLQGMTKEGKQIRVIESRRTEVAPYLKRLDRLFLLAKALEPSE